MIQLKNVTYTYPFQQTPALSDVSMEVNPGEVVLVTGASGCGKSTLIRIINGLCPHFYMGDLKGEIKHNGESQDGKKLKDISQIVGTVFQDPELQFFALNVADEIAFAHECRGKDPEEIKKIISKTAEDLKISHILSSSILELSQGQKQKLALASIISLNPSIVVLDEPTANLDPESTEELADHIQELKNKGIAVLIVDHRLYWLKDTADKVVVMDKGKIVEQGDFSILDNKEIREEYGLRNNKVQDVRTTLPGLPENGSIEVKNLSFAYKKKPKLFDNDSFSIPRGITGIIGDNGAGKTTIARLLTGLTKMKHGSLVIDGEKVPPKKMLKRSKIILQNTDHQLHMNSVIQEIAASSGDMKAAKRDKEKILLFLEMFGLEKLAYRHPQSLSGGEKQRLVIACGLAAKPDIIILDEPTSGLDGRNMEMIAQIMRKTAEKGTSVVVITHDLELLERVCDAALYLPFNSEKIKMKSLSSNN